MDELDKSMSYLEFPRRHSGKETACQCKRHSFDPWVGKIPGGGNGNPLQYSFLGNPMDTVSKDLDMTEHSAHAYIKSVYKVDKG